MDSLPVQRGLNHSLGWRVLAIDDDPLFLEVMRVCLERSGCTVQTVSDPREGLNLAIEGEFDLILLDLMMPGMAGEEILELLKPLSLKQKIVVVSGCDEHDARAKSRDLGAVGYIQKPVDTRQFTFLLVDLLQDPIQETTPVNEMRSRGLLNRLVSFVFGECEATFARRLGAIVILVALSTLTVVLIAG